jgi:hypothetical protein
MMFPHDAPPINAGFEFWQRYLQSASDDQVLQCWKAAIRFESDTIRELSAMIGFGRWAQRTQLARREFACSN